ncbi:MAG: InlB B-repeat-containing protein [Clostridia bacterium]|nr:InlB B-repeat-containing protein [Clostridia bacterium]
MTKKIFAAIVVLCMVMTFIPAAVFAGDMALSDDGSGSFFLDLPKGGGDLSLDLSEKACGFSFTLYDDGGKAANYSDNYDASLIITAPENTYLSISGSGYTESNYDYLTVYDGNTDKILSGKHSGSFSINTCYTSSNVLKVCFASDGGVNQTGFELTVTVVDPADILKVSFDAGDGSGSMTPIVGAAGDEFTLPECTFTLPENTFFDYYTDGENIYYPGDKYTLAKSVTLTAVYVEGVTVTFVSGDETKDISAPKGKIMKLPGYRDLFELPYRTEFMHWEKDGAEFDATDEYTPDGNTTFTAVLQDLPVLIDDGENGFYALMPKTGDAELDLSDKENGFSLMVYDDGGKDGGYSSGCDGSLTLTAPEGFIFMISGTLSSDYYDTLSIYDTDMTSYIGGYALDGFGTTFSDHYSTGNKIKLKFTSSDYSYSYDGFAFKITLADPETLLKVSFDRGEGYGSMADMGALRGIAFTLPKCNFYPNYGMIFVGYTDGTIIYGEGDKVTLYEDTTFTALFAEKATVIYTYGYSSEQFDYAKGTKITLPEYTSMFEPPSRQLFSCWKADETEYEAGDEYTVNGDVTFEAIFVPEPVLVEDGEGGFFVNMDKTEELTADISDKNIGFSFKVYDDGGKDANYSSRCSGYLNITAPAGTILKISGAGKTESRYWDYLTVYDSDGTTQLGGRNFGGEFSFENLTSYGNSVKLYFRSDSWSENEGFELTVTVVEPADITYAFGDEINPVVVEKGSEVIIANFEKLFELPYGKEFICWQNGNDKYAPGDTYTANENIILTAVLADMPVVTLDGNGASLSGDSGKTSVSFPVNAGKENTFPSAKDFFDVPEGKVFGGWKYGNVIYNVGDTFSTTEDITFTAVWLEPSPWDDMAETLNAESGTDLGTIVLNEDLVGGTGSDMLYVPKGVTATLDLAGHKIDGTKTAALDEHGVIILVKGNLTIKDTASGGEIKGGGIRVLNGGTLSWDGVSDSFEASVESSYSLIDHETNTRLDDTYCQTYYSTLKDALLASALPVTGYEESLETIPEHDNYMFSYNDEYVKMLKDAELPEGETWEINPRSDDLRSIWFDLNGHTFDIKGTITGGTPGTRTIGGVEEDCIYPTDFHMVSTTPGTVKLSGIINLSIQPWTQDTYYFTDGGFGENASFFADGGTYYISGGHFIPTMTFNNGNQKANLSINISDDAEFNNLQYVIYDYESDSPTQMTIEGDARIKNMDYRVMGNGGGARPTLVLSGGYFAFDPMTLFSGYVPVDPDDVDQNNLDQYYVNRYGSMVSYAELEENEKTLFTDYYEFSGTFLIDDGSAVLSGDVEEYADQADWAADSSVYKFRFGAPDPTALTLLASRSENEIAYEIKNAPESFVLIAAQYDGNALSDIKILENPDTSGTINMRGTGTVKLFLNEDDIITPLLKVKELK